MRGTLPDGEGPECQIRLTHNLENDKEEIKKMSLSSNNITITEITGVFFRLNINTDVASFFLPKKITTSLFQFLPHFLLYSK